MSDLISRQAAIDALDKIISMNYKDWARAQNAIRQLPSAQIEQRWIPVTERLPEKHEWVLVRSKLVKMKTDFISNEGSWYATPGVTHWIPLPEPPKVERKDDDLP